MQDDLVGLGVFVVGRLFASINLMFKHFNPLDYDLDRCSLDLGRLYVASPEINDHIWLLRDFTMQLGSVVQPVVGPQIQEDMHDFFAGFYSRFAFEYLKDMIHFE